MQIEFAFELIEDLISGIDVKIFRRFGPRVTQAMKLESSQITRRCPQFPRLSSIYCRS